jgi:hypothetical protein
MIESGRFFRTELFLQHISKLTFVKVIREP